MRKISFSIAIFGLAILISFLLSEPKNVSTMDRLISGQNVIISGIAESVREVASGLIFEIEDIVIFCRCSGIKSGDNLEIEGVIEDYDGKREIEALIVKIT